jgi:hypothetical protein
VGRHLQAVSPSPASLQIPASIGEVVDKITILELRAFGEDYPEAERLLLWASRSSPLSAATAEPGLEPFT